MHKIEETDFGYRMTFEGFLKANDVTAWVRDLRTHLGSRSGPFGVLVDMRGAAVFPAEAQEALLEGINYCKSRGMERATVVVANPITKLQAVRVSKETGIYKSVRHLDASSDPHWETTATDWITKGVDPD